MQTRLGTAALGSAKRKLMPGRLYKFGLFEFDTAARQLQKQGRGVRIQEQPLRILEVLLEEPGRLVTRQELRERLWPHDVHVDFDLGLTGAIKRLRLALGDSGENPLFIETVPKSGYRFVAPVHIVESTASAGPTPIYSPVASNHSGTATAAQMVRDPSSDPIRAGVAPSRSVRPGRRASIAAAALAGLSVLGYWARPQMPAPRVTRVVKLTTSGAAWPQEPLFTDGPRLYYTEFTPGTGFQLRQILLNGNEDTPVGPLPHDSLIRAISPDHTMFLAVSRAELVAKRLSPVWAVPVIGGQARRVGDLLTNNVSWSPDGRKLAFSGQHQLWVADADGSQKRMVAQIAGSPSQIRWSPDGGRLRFVVEDARSQISIWEVKLDGGQPHPLQFNLPGPAMEGVGDWTPDGRYFVLSSRREGVSNIWVVEEQHDWLHRSRREPAQLTAGPLNYYRPLLSADGKQIFAIGRQAAGELLRYDLKPHDFVPFLGGISADRLDYSRDGAWVAYIAYPEGTLWRARSDGREQLQLTFAPSMAGTPRWSPDGKRIVFTERRPGELPRLYSISAEGGNPEPLLSEPHAQAGASWAPSGEFLIYGRDPDGENQDIFLYRFDVRARTSSRIPGTEGLYAPLISPDGRSLVAQNTADPSLTILDLKTNRRASLSDRKADYPAWSPDSEYIYFNTMNYSLEPALFRIRVADHELEKITDIRFPTGGTYGGWSGLGPDGSLLVLRTHSQTDIYALTLAVK